MIEEPPVLTVERKRNGTPPGYAGTVEQAKQAVIAHYEEGLSLDRIAALPGMPSVTTVYRWEDEDPSFGAALVRARTRAAGSYAIEATAVLREEPPRIGADGRMDSGFVQWKKNLSDGLFRMAKCFDRATYGDQVAVEHSGGVTLTAAGVRERLSGDSEVQKLIAGRVVPQKPTE